MGLSSHIYEYTLPMRFLRMDSVAFCDVLDEFEVRNKKLKELDFLRNNLQVLFFRLSQHFTISFIWK